MRQRQIKYKGLTPEEIWYSFKDRFTFIEEGGNFHKNHIPENTQVTVYTRTRLEEGIIWDTNCLDLGYHIFFAKAWIKQELIEELIGNS